MKRICAGLGHRIHRGCCVSAARCVLGTGDDSELLKRIWKWKRHVRPIIRIQMRRPIQVVLDAETQSAGNGDVHTAGHVISGRCTCLYRQTAQRDQIGNVPPVKRQFQYLLGVDQRRSDTHASSFHLDRVGFHANRLRHSSDLERNVDRRSAAHRQNDAAFLRCGEASLAYLNYVRSEWKVGQHVTAVRLGGSCPRLTFVGLRCLYLCVGNEGTTGVLNCSVNLCCGLSPRGGRVHYTQ